MYRCTPVTSLLGVVTETAKDHADPTQVKQAFSHRGQWSSAYRMDGWTVCRRCKLICTSVFMPWGANSIHFKFQGKLIIKCDIGWMRVGEHFVHDVKPFNPFSVKEKVWIQTESGASRTERQRLVNVIKAVSPWGKMCVSGLHLRLNNVLFLFVSFCFVTSFTSQHF